MSPKQYYEEDLLAWDGYVQASLGFFLTEENGHLKAVRQAMELADEIMEERIKRKIAQRFITNEK